MSRGPEDGISSPRELALYAASFLLIFWLGTLIPSGWVQGFTAQASSWALNAAGLSSGHGSVDGQAFLTLEGGARYVRVLIIRECTAIHVLVILAGMIIPLKGGWGRKALSLLVGGLLTFLMNTSRITLTVYLAGYDVPPFSWFIQSPTVETYHYPVSFLYGVAGVAVLVMVISRWTMPELGYTLVSIPGTIQRALKEEPLFEEG